MTWGISSNEISRRSSTANVASSVPSDETTVEPSTRSKFSMSPTSGSPFVNDA